MLVNDLKFAPAGRVIIFSDEKTWTVDSVRNRRNNRYLSLGEEDESAGTDALKRPSCLSVSLHPMAQ